MLYIDIIRKLQYLISNYKTTLNKNDIFLFIEQWPWSSGTKNTFVIKTCKKSIIKLDLYVIKFNIYIKEIYLRSIWVPLSWIHKLNEDHGRSCLTRINMIIHIILKMLKFVGRNKIWKSTKLVYPMSWLEWMRSHS